MDGADVDPWSEVAEGWAELWGRFAEPAWAVVLQAAGTRPGGRVLDVGCGSGELLAHLDANGFSAAGVDPAPGMVAHARRRAPGADIRLGDAENLPWPAAGFDLVVTVNALHLVADVPSACAELVRVTAPGGHVAIVGWAEGSLNDLDTIEAAVALADGDEPRPDDDLRLAGRLENILAGAGLDVVASGLVEVPWWAADDDTLVRGVLLGEDPDTIADTAPIVIAAAEPFRTPNGGYRLVNRLRHAVGRAPGRTG